MVRYQADPSPSAESLRTGFRNLGAPIRLGVGAESNPGVYDEDPVHRMTSSVSRSRDGSPSRSEGGSIHSVETPESRLHATREVVSGSGGGDQTEVFGFHTSVLDDP